MEANPVLSMTFRSERRRHSVSWRSLKPSRTETRTAPKGERVTVQLEVEAAVDAILAAGLLASVGNPALATRFRALVPTKVKRTPKTA